MAECVILSELPVVLERRPPAAASAAREDRGAIADLLARCDAVAERADRDKVLELTVRTAQQFSHASSAAVAWLHSHNMICVGRSGEEAPDLGACIDVSAGLSRECVVTGTPVHCDDAARDPRVHPSFHHSTGLRSILAVPLIHHGAVTGLLEVFSPQANAFGEIEAAVLQLLAGLMVEVLSSRSDGSWAVNTSLNDQSATHGKLQEAESTSGALPIGSQSGFVSPDHAASLSWESLRRELIVEFGGAPASPTTARRNLSLTPAVGSSLPSTSPQQAKGNGKRLVGRITNWFKTGRPPNYLVS
jgi:GAF domain-containing protein